MTVTGLEWLNFVHSEDRERCERVFQKGIERREEIDVDYRLRRADGEFRWMIDFRPAALRWAGNVSRSYRRGLRNHGTQEGRGTSKPADAGARSPGEELLARMLAIIELSRADGRSVNDFASSLGGRIDSMAKMHSRLSQSNWSGISVRTLVGDALEPYRIEGRTEIAGPEIILKPTATQALAMVLYELATNAVKYGALSSSFGIVRVKWEERGEANGPRNLVLTWREFGGPPVSRPTREGYGSTVIRELVRYEIGGVTTLTFEPGGVAAEIIVPLSNVLDTRAEAQSVAGRFLAITMRSSVSSASARIGFVSTAATRCLSAGTTS